MHIRRLNQHGFSAIEIAIFVIVLGLLGSGGYVAYNRIQDNQSQQETLTPTTEEKTDTPLQAGTTQATANWASVVSGKGGFALRIPDGWLLANYRGDNMLQGDQITYQPGTKATIEEQAGSYSGGDSIFRFTITQDPNTQQAVSYDTDAVMSPFTTATLKGTRYYKKYPVVAQDGIGPYAGTESYGYEFKTDKTTTVVNYYIYHYNKFSKQVLGDSFTKSDPDQHELVEQALQTLRVKE